VVPASIVAVLLLAAMVVVVWSCVQVLLGQAPLIPFVSLVARGTALRWNDLAVLVGGGVLAGLGLVLLACAWLPGAPNVLSLADVGDQTRAGATRRSVRHAVVTAASRVDGVSAATAQVTASRVRTTVRTPLRSTGELPAQVRAAVGERLTTIALRRPPTITVRVNRTRSS
jgi:hypothetical protein